MPVYIYCYLARKTYPNLPAPSFLPRSKSSTVIDSYSGGFYIFGDDLALLKETGGEGETGWLTSGFFDLLRKTIEKRSLLVWTEL
jgi:hypothetical protein